MKKLTFNRKKLVRAIYAACLALTLAATQAKAQFSVNGGPPSDVVVVTGNNTITGANAFSGYALGTNGVDNVSISSNANITSTAPALISIDAGTVNNSGTLSSTSASNTYGILITGYSGNGSIVNSGSVYATNTAAEYTTALNAGEGNGGTFSIQNKGVAIATGGTTAANYAYEDTEGMSVYTDDGTGSVTLSNSDYVEGTTTTTAASVTDEGNEVTIYDEGMGGYVYGGGVVTVLNSGTTQASTYLTLTGDAGYYNDAYGYSSGIDTDVENGAIKITNTGVANGYATVSAEGYSHASGYGIYAEASGASTISIANSGSAYGYAEATSVSGYGDEGHASASGIYAEGDSDSIVTISILNENSASAYAEATGTYDSEARGSGISAYATYGAISVINQGSASGYATANSGTNSGYAQANGYGISADSFAAPIAITNTGSAYGEATASSTYSLYSGSPSNTASAYASGIYADSEIGSISIVNAGAAYGKSSISVSSNSTYSLYTPETPTGGTAIGNSTATGIFAGTETGNIAISNSGYAGGDATAQVSAASGYEPTDNPLNARNLVSVSSSATSNLNASGISASTYSGSIAIVNQKGALASAYSSSSTYALADATAYEFDSDSAYGNTTATATGAAVSTGISASTYSGNISITNAGNALAYGDAEANSVASGGAYGGDGDTVGGTGTATATQTMTASGILTTSGSGMTKIANSGLAIGVSAAYAHATSYGAGGIEAFEVPGSGSGYTTSVATATGSGYGINATASTTGAITIVNTGGAFGGGYGEARTYADSSNNGGDYNISTNGFASSFANGYGTGTGIYASTYSGDISIINTGYAVGVAAAYGDSTYDAPDTSDSTYEGYARAVATGISANSGFGNIGVNNSGVVLAEAEVGFDDGGFVQPSVTLGKFVKPNFTPNIPAGNDSGDAYATSISTYGEYGKTTILNSGTAAAYVYDDGLYDSNSGAYGINAGSYSGDIKIVNTGTVSASNYSEEFSLVVPSVIRPFIDGGGVYATGINAASEYGNISILNSGTVSAYSNGSSAGIYVENPYGTIKIHNSSKGVINAFSSGPSYGIYLSDFGDDSDVAGVRPAFASASGSPSATITNEGVIDTNGVGIYGGDYGDPTTVNLPGGAIYSDGEAILLGDSSVNVVTIYGRSYVEGLMDGGNYEVPGIVPAIIGEATGNTLNFNVAGATPAQIATLKATEAEAENDPTGYYTVELGGESYSWTDFQNFGGHPISFEQENPRYFQLGRALDNLSGPLPPGFDPFYVAAYGNPNGALSELSGDEILNAYDSIQVNQATQFDASIDTRAYDLRFGGGGGIDTSGLNVSDSNLMASLESTQNQLGSLMMSGTSMTDTKAMSDSKQVMQTASMPRWGGWASGNVNLTTQSDVDSIPGYHATIGSPTIGADYRFTDSFVAGVLGNYTDAGARFNDGSTLDADTELLGVYGTWFKDNAHVNGVIGGGLTQYDTTRDTFTDGHARSKPDGDEITAAVTGGYDFKMGSWLLSPEAGLQYTHIDVDGYSESGAGIFDLNVADEDIDSLRAKVGGRVTTSYDCGFMKLMPELRANYYHEFMDENRGVSESLAGAPVLGSFAIQTAKPQRDFAILGAGLSAVPAQDKSLTFFINYDVQVGQADYIANDINGGLRVDF